MTPEVPSPRARQGPGAAAVLAAAAGLCAGGAAAAFRLALDLVERLHHATTGFLVGAAGAWGWAAAAIVAAAIGGVARWLVFRFAPETSGSGIPAVEARLRGAQPMRWARILGVKFTGGLAALATGMSLGREGPIVQMGAALGEAFGTSLRSSRLRKALVAAGAGAGLTGAFDAPVAGVLFVLEELRWEMSALTYATALAAALAAQLVVGAVFGPGPILGAIDPPPLAAAGLLLAAACGVVCGLCGVAYNRAILRSLDLFERWRSVPCWVHGAAAGATALLVGACLPAAVFGGETITAQVVHGSVAELAARQGGLVGTVATGAGGPALFLALLVATKLCLTALSYGSGVVGGLFAPQIVIGAALGGLLGELAAPLAPGAGPGLVPALAGAGAVAMFTASVRVPITGVVLLLEMTGSIRQAYAFAVAGAVAFLVATALGDEPIYEALGRRTARQARGLATSVVN